MKEIISADSIVSKINYIRGCKVMLDKDIAALYGVETKVLNQAVARNPGRFPKDFMFRLSIREFRNLKSQFVTSSWGGTRKPPSAFTEQGVAMLASVLNSPRAIQVNIQIIRVFVRLRQMTSSHEDLRKKIEAMEEKFDGQFRIVFQAIKELLRDDSGKNKKIGFPLGASGGAPRPREPGCTPGTAGPEKFFGFFPSPLDFPPTLLYIYIEFSLSRKTKHAA